MGSSLFPQEDEEVVMISIKERKRRPHSAMARQEVEHETSLIDAPAELGNREWKARQQNQLC